LGRAAGPPQYPTLHPTTKHEPLFHHAL